MALIQELKGGLSQLLAGGRSVTQFIRTSPIISGATLGGSVLAGLTIAQVIRRVRKKRKVSRRKKTSRRKIIKRRKKVRKVRRVRAPTRRRVKRGRHVHRSPRHRGHQRVSFTTKTGQKVNFLVKSSSSQHRRKRRTRK